MLRGLNTTATCNGEYTENCTAKGVRGVARKAIKALRDAKKAVRSSFCLIVNLLPISHAVSVVGGLHIGLQSRARGK